MGLKKEDLAVDEYIKRFCSLCDNLAAIGKPINDLDKCIHLSRGLGPKYQDFRLAMSSKAPYPTFTRFVLALRRYEQVFLNNQAETKRQMDYAQAFLGQHSCGRGCGGWFQLQGRGYNSGGRADSSKQSSGSQGNNGTQQSKNIAKEGNKSANTNTVVCQLCGRLYHISVKCWNQCDYLEEKPRQANTALKHAEDTTFFADFGATVHMKNNSGTLAHKIL